MKINTVIFFCLIISLSACAQNKSGNTNPIKQQMATNFIKKDSSEWNKLTAQEENIIVYKGTEFPGTGELLHNKQKGTYTCRRCDAALYNSDSKFESHCGWPSFDDEIPGAVKRIPDGDGQRTEIVCSNCGAHLGHVFLGERFTAKNTRHCVNSVSMKFVPSGN